jgi:hypothetical protein
MFNLNLPSGKAIVFRAPTFVDRRNILKEYNRNDGYLPEDLLAAKCIVQIDGTQVEDAWDVDVISLLDTWSLLDQAFYMEVFMNMFNLDDKAKTAAAEEAKKLMGASMNGTSKSGKASKLTV